MQIMNNTVPEYLLYQNGHSHDTDNKSIAIANVIMLHAKKHTPKTKVAGVNYIVGKRHLLMESLENHFDEPFISMPVTYHKGEYIPFRADHSHEVVNYAAVSVSDAKKIIGADRIVGKGSMAVRIFLHRINVKSYS